MGSRYKKKYVFALQDVTFSFPNGPPLVQKLSFAIKYQESVAILAPEGTGRTSILKLMIGMLEPQAGKVYLNEFPVNKLPEKVLRDYRAQVGFLFAQGALINNLSIFDNVALPLRYHSSLDEDKIQELTYEILDRFHILVAADQRPSFVSDYVCIATGIARAVIMTPPAYIIDNIFDGLSRKHVVQIVSILNEITQLSEGTFVYTSNDPELLHHLAERVLFIHGGKVYYDGSFNDFFESQDPTICSYLKDTFVQKQLRSATT